MARVPASTQTRKQLKQLLMELERQRPGAGSW